MKTPSLLALSYVFVAMWFWFRPVVWEYAWKLPEKIQEDTQLLEKIKTVGKNDLRAQYERETRARIKFYEDKRYWIYNTMGHFSTLTYVVSVLLICYVGIFFSPFPYAMRFVATVGLAALGMLVLGFEINSLVVMAETPNVYNWTLLVLDLGIIIYLFLTSLGLIFSLRSTQHSSASSEVDRELKRLRENRP